MPPDPQSPSPLCSHSIPSFPSSVAEGVLTDADVPFHKAENVNKSAVQERNRSPHAHVHPQYGNPHISNGVVHTDKEPLYAAATNTSPIMETYISASETTIPDTDPIFVRDLWQEVRSSQNRITQPTASEITETTITTNDPLGMSQKAFRSRVLQGKFGITILDQIVRPFNLANQHFETEAVPEGRTYGDFLKDQSVHSDVWLTLSKEEIETISTEYFIMDHRRLCDGEFRYSGVQMLLKRDKRFSIQKGDEGGDWHGWTPERMMNFRFKPSEDLPAPPPRSQWNGKATPTASGLGQSQAAKRGGKSARSGYDFGFETDPDCTYWLNSHSLPNELRVAFRVGTFLAVADTVACPYFTIQFTDSTSSSSFNMEAAENQVAATSALILYNRFRLHQARRAKYPKQGANTSDFALRHYALTLGRSKFAFWVMKLTTDGQQGLGKTQQWLGCTMTRLTLGDLQSTSEVKRFVNWYHEIHRWGLTVYGPKCAEDILISFGCDDSEIQKYGCRRQPNIAKTTTSSDYSTSKRHDRVGLISESEAAVPEDVLCSSGAAERTSKLAEAPQDSGQSEGGPHFPTQPTSEAFGVSETARGTATRLNSVLEREGLVEIRW